MSDYIYIDLDKWAFDIEMEYEKNGILTTKEKRQYCTLCLLRDKYFKIHDEKRYREAREKGYNNPCMIPKCCSERLYYESHKNRQIGEE